MSEEQTIANEEKDVKYLGFWARFVAFLIDSIAVSLVLTPLTALIIGEVVIDPANPQIGEQLPQLMSQFTFQVVFVGTVFILFWIVRNATPGKMVFGSVIVDAETLKAPTAAQNIIRYVSYYVSLIPFGLGFIWIAFDKKKQGWHDKIARTVVIKGKPREDAPAE